MSGGGVIAFPGAARWAIPTTAWRSTTSSWVSEAMRAGQRPGQLRRPGTHPLGGGGRQGFQGETKAKQCGKKGKVCKQGGEGKLYNEARGIFRGSSLSGVDGKTFVRLMGLLKLSPKGQNNIKML